MINIRTLKKLNNNDGLTLKNGKIINYKAVGRLRLKVSKQQILLKL